MWPRQLMSHIDLRKLQQFKMWTADSWPVPCCISPAAQDAAWLWDVWVLQLLMMLCTIATALWWRRLLHVSRQQPQLMILSIISATSSLSLFPPWVTANSSTCSHFPGLWVCESINNALRHQTSLFWTRSCNICTATLICRWFQLTPHYCFEFLTWLRCMHLKYELAVSRVTGWKYSSCLLQLLKVG